MVAQSDISIVWHLLKMLTWTFTHYFVILEKVTLYAFHTQLLGTLATPNIHELESKL